MIQTSTETMLLSAGVGVAGLWGVGVGITMLTDFRGLATWWARQPDIWRPSPRRDAPITPRRLLHTRVTGLFFLTSGLLAVVSAMVVVTDSIASRWG
ncbi:hypothetical protein [Actinoallomurus sp. NPDC052274]|uniref:hypothetical protein n=1 Tax=Actinoallomurus sp. NPDC052274 TaxID=3155420 RepID=UPI00342136B5